MTRVPELERLLAEAAARLQAQARPPSLAVRKRQRLGTLLLAGAAAVTLCGVAIAAGAGLLSSGDPVPARSNADGVPTPDSTNTLRVLSIRASDPDGGPPWALGVYGASRPTSVACTMVGREQDGQLGVLGRDGVFNDDGQFHPLQATSEQALTCSGHRDDGTYTSASDGPPIPASGYAGRPGTSIGGCREPVDLNGPTVSEQTRQRLRDVPVCAAASMRIVK